MEPIVQHLRNPETAGGRARSALARLGFRDPGRALGALERMRERLLALAACDLDRLLTGLGASPDPGLALTAVEQCFGAADAPALGELLSSPRPDALLLLFGTSPFLTEIFRHEPDLLHELDDALLRPSSRTPVIREKLRADARRGLDRDSSLAALRREQRRELFRIGLRDVAGVAPLETTTRDLSTLADHVIAWVLESVARDLGPKGVPHGGDGTHSFDPASALAVVSLGKLGGNELNYFSDVDLIYVHRDTEDPREADLLRRLAQELTRELSRVTSEGTLYRVDLRLRPDGEASPIAGGVSSLVAYYNRRAHVWELISFLKARPCAGNRSLASSLVETVRKILTTQFELRSPTAEIARLLRRIRDALPAAESRTNLKLMPGGIREIEFLVQATQLVHGRARSDLLEPNTLEAIGRLRAAGLIDADEAGLLETAYRLFRATEHRIQMERAIQSHLLPVEPEALELLGRRVAAGPGPLRATDDFAAHLAGLLTRVRNLSDRVLEGQKAGRFDRLFLLDPGDPSAAEILGPYGFTDVARAHRALLSLAHGSFPNLEDRETARALDAILPDLLDGVGATPDPDRALENLARIVTAGRALRATYELFATSPDFLRLLADLAGYSTVHAGRLARDIGYLDGLVEALARFDPSDPTGPGNVANPPRIETVPERSLERSLERLCLWRYRRETAALLALGGPGKGGEPFSRFLATVAARGLSHLIEGLAAERALPAFAVVALGSLAAETIHAKSDLDLIVVLEDTGPEGIEEATRFFHEVTRHARCGLDYRVDFRLRGEGESSPLVQTLSYYQSYFQSRGQLWERVAFLKHRYIHGDERLARRFEETLGAFLFDRPFGRAEVEEMMAYRKGLERLATGGGWDVKWAAGGEYDLEYVRAAGALALGREPGSRLDASRPFEALAEAGLLCATEAEALERAARAFAHLDLVGSLHGLHRTTSEEGRRRLARILVRLGLPDRTGVGDGPQRGARGTDAGADEERVRAWIGSIRLEVRTVYRELMGRLAHRGP